MKFHIEDTAKMFGYGVLFGTPASRSSEAATQKRFTPTSPPPFFAQRTA